MPSSEMTSRERFLAAIRNQVPDRVPVAPDISTYIPTRRTGLPFWEVLMEGRVPLWQAYLEAAEYYGLDAWTAPEFAKLTIPVMRACVDVLPATRSFPERTCPWPFWWCPSARVPVCAV